MTSAVVAARRARLLCMLAMAAVGQMAGAPPAVAADATALVCLRFDGPWPPDLARLVESDLRRAFERRGVELCAPEGGEPKGRPSVNFALTISDPAMNEIRLTMAPPADYPVDRRFDLRSVPADGRVLAVVMAADDMLAASKQLLAPPTATATTTPPSAPPVLAPAPASAATTTARTRDDLQRISVSFAVEHYGGGQTHLGPDVAWSGRSAGWLFVEVAAGLRQGLTARAEGGSVQSRLAGGRLALGLGRTLAGGRLFAGVDLGLRGGRLWFEGLPSGGGQGVGAAAWLAYVDSTASLVARLASRLALRAAVGAGAPVLSQGAAEAAQDATSVVTAASGPVLTAQLGAAILF